MAVRWLLRVWARFAIAPGHLYQNIERWGSLLAVGPLECRLFDGARLTCDLRDHIQRHIYFFGAYEPIEAYLFSTLMQPGMIVVDAGANIGQYSLIAAMKVGVQGEVHAFEPAPKNFERLTAHIRENGFTSNVKMNMAALWHNTDILALNLRSHENAGTYTVAEIEPTVERVVCKAIRLDDYFSGTQLRKVDFIKMDIEGAEWLALQGAKALLSTCQPVILMEICRDLCRVVGYEPERIWEFLRRYGYRMWLVGNSPERCVHMSTLNGVNRANVIFHLEPLPETVTSTTVSQNRRTRINTDRTGRREKHEILSKTPYFQGVTYFF